MYYMFFFLQMNLCFLWLTVFSPNGTTYPLGSLWTNRKIPHSQKASRNDFHWLLGQVLPLPLQKSLLLSAMSESGGDYQLSFPEKGGLIREGAYLKEGGLNRGFTVLPRVIICLICCRWETHVKIWSHWWLDWYLWRTQRSSMERYINWRCHKGSHWCSWLHSVCSGHNI